MNEENASTVELLEAIPVGWSLYHDESGWSIWDTTTDTWQAYEHTTAAEALREAEPNMQLSAEP